MKNRILYFEILKSKLVGCVYCFAVREEVEESIEEMAEMNADSETLPETNLTEIVGGETKHVRKLMALRTDPKTVSLRLT